MKKELKTTKDLYKKLFNHLYKLIGKGKLDQSISGNQFWQFNERGIKVLNPTEVILKKLKDKK
ncbi:MAG TPA: hypothetical protein VMZ91_03375 [Candidatus Paceibacterota bacterium]|nr:hypothetical protein [Candidatus Paceibacterota bacterium]